MLRTMMKSKLHHATVTGADVHYMGSITLDPILMEAADLLPHERVQVLDVDNGARLETYVIEGERGSGEVVLNGPAARLVAPGDKVVVVSYGAYDAEELRAHRPLVVFCDARNRPSLVAPEAPGTRTPPGTAGTPGAVEPPGTSAALGATRW